MTFQVELTPLAQDDFNSLDNSQKIHVRKSFQKLELVGMQAGEALSGKLSGCRKLKHRKLGLRIVFRQFDNRIEVIEVVAIGKRSDNEIYKIAEKRIREQ